MILFKWKVVFTSFWRRLSLNLREDDNCTYSNACRSWIYSYPFLFYYINTSTKYNDIIFGFSGYYIWLNLKVDRPFSSAQSGSFQKSFQTLKLMTLNSRDKDFRKYLFLRDFPSLTRNISGVNQKSVNETLYVLKINTFIFLHTTFYSDLLAEVRSVTPKMSGSFQFLHFPGHTIMLMSGHRWPHLSSLPAASAQPGCFSRPSGSCAPGAPACVAWSGSGMNIQQFL